MAPKAQALKCKDCHMEGKRLEWKALGYAGDPMRAGGRFETNIVGEGSETAQAVSGKKAAKK